MNITNPAPYAKDGNIITSDELKKLNINTIASEMEKDVDNYISIIVTTEDNVSTVSYRGKYYTIETVLHMAEYIIIHYKDQKYIKSHKERLVTNHL